MQLRKPNITIGITLAQFKTKNSLCCKVIFKFFNVFLKIMHIETKNKLLTKRLKNKRKMLAENMEARRLQWLDQVRENEDFRSLYNQGAVQLAHPDNINFRSRNKSKEIPHYYSHITDKQKSLQNMQDYQDGHLIKESYDDKSPHKSTGWLRPRVLDREINQKPRYNVKSQNERLKQHFSTASLINEEPLNTNILYNTPYREFNKNKWVSTKPYIT